jgi:uncharacterized protein YkwD
MDTLRALRVLGLAPSASTEEIKSAWRDLTKVWHPDRFPHDERLQQKAGENLQRINEAHEALRNYDPAKTPKLAARMRESVAIILGMGELGDPPPPSARAAPEQPLTPSAPIGLRHSLRVLGLGNRRVSGEAGTRHRSSPGWLIVLVILVALALAVVSLLRSQQPDPQGRAIVDEINRLRTDPAGYAAILEQILPLYAGNDLQRPGQITIRTNEGAAGVREAIAALRAQAPLGPLGYSEGLTRAAADLVRDQGPSGATGHVGSDGSTMSARIERYGQWGGGISENIDYGSTTAREVVTSLVVDDGVSSRGHRRNLLDPAIRFAGAACGPHQRYQTMCVMDHAGSFTPSGMPRPR